SISQLASYSVIFSRLILSSAASLFFLIRPLQSSILFPYTTLFRSLDIVFFTDGDMPLALYKTHSEKLEQLKPYKMFSNLWGTYGDRKSTRLNSSHVSISYAVFCLKKKKKKIMYCLNCTQFLSYARF